MELSHFREFEIPVTKYNFKYIKGTFQTFCSRAEVHCDAFRVICFPYSAIQRCHVNESQLVILITK